MNLDAMRAALRNGNASCNMVSPAKMNAEQADQYAQAQLFLEQLEERLVEAGDYRMIADVVVDKARHGLT